MLSLPEWCTQDYFARYAGGQVHIINRYIDTSFHGDISEINLNPETGRLTIMYNWFAAGVDENNRCSLTRRTGWVEDSDPIEHIDLWTTLGDQGMMFYIGRPVSDGRLIMDGGELMEAIFTFMPPGIMSLARSDVQAADPNNPIDRTVRYVAGQMPGGKRLPSGTQYAWYRPDADAQPKRDTLGDDGK